MQLVSVHRLEELVHEVRTVVLSQVDALEAVIAVLETAQRSLPRLSEAELARMERGERSVTQVVYLLGRLEAAIVELDEAADNIAHDFSEEGLREFSSRKLCSLEFRDIEGAIRRVAE